MTVAAPPQPPQLSESAGHDPGEALIKEAKQRARRRRWIYGGAAVVVAIAAVAAFSRSRGSTSPPHRAARDVPDTNRTDSPRRAARRRSGRSIDTAHVLRTAPLGYVRSRRPAG